MPPGVASPPRCLTRLVLPPDVDERARDLTDGGAAPHRVDDEWHQHRPFARGAAGAVTGGARPERGERRIHFIVIAARSRLTNASGLPTLETRVVRGWHVGRVAAVGKAIDADHDGFA